MKTFFSLAALAIMASVSSCQKVIDVDLNTQDPKIVIEGEVTDDTLTPARVHITQSVNFSAVNSFPAVSGAVVTIKSNNGDSFLLNETSPGIYEASALKGRPGRTYFLAVVSGGKTYTAQSTMPAKVALDSVTVADFGFGGQASAKSVTPVYRDPEGRGNRYRLKLYDNKKVSSSIDVFDDEAVDGTVNTRPLFSQDKYMTFDVGDTAAVKLMCIDKAVYDYFFSLSQNSSGPNESASPSNPLTNIKGAALGYFSAHTVDIKKVIIR